MSITFEMTGESIWAWPLTSRCIEQVERIRAAGGRRFIEVLFGPEIAHMGTARVVPRLDLSDAVESLADLADSLSPGFEMSISMFGGDSPVGGMLSTTVDGRNYVFKCKGEYWTMQPTDEMARGLPAEERTEPAEFHSEFFGRIRIVKKKSGGTDILRLLQRIRNHLKDDPGNAFTVVIG